MNLKLMTIVLIALATMKMLDFDISKYLGPPSVRFTRLLRGYKTRSPTLPAPGWQARFIQLREARRHFGYTSILLEHDP